MAGIFITFEGIDGSGKSTQIARFSEHLQSIGRPVAVTREPGGTQLSESIREIILNRKFKGINARTETLLYLAARSQIIAEIIRPALKEGKVVLSDRFFDSTFAYQGGGRGLSLSEIEPLNQFACEGLVPNLTFLIDIPVAESIARRKKLGKAPDRMEGEGKFFLEKVRSAYLDLAKRYASRYIVLDGTQSLDEIQGEITDHFRKRFSNA